MKTVLMIGGGVQHVRAVAMAHEFGYKIAVTDRLAHAPAFKGADHTLCIDGRDVEGLCAAALIHRDAWNLAGVFTLSELVTSVAAVAAVLGVPGVPLRAAIECQNKALAKRVWQRAGVPTPNGALATSAVEARDIAARLGFPVFLKPAVGFGSAGAKRAVDVRALDDATFSAGGVLVEEFVSGSMHDVNAVFDATGGFYPLGIADRFFRDELPVEREFRIPTVLSAAEQAELYQLTQRGARALGIACGPVKADAVRTSHGFQLLEMAPRLHGPKGTLYGFPFSGFEPLRGALRVLVGDTLGPAEAHPRTTRHVLCRALECPPGRLRSVQGVDKARTLPGVDDIMMFVDTGARVVIPRSNADVPGYIFVSGVTAEECERRAAAASATIRFELGDE